MAAKNSTFQSLIGLNGSDNHNNKNKQQHYRLAKHHLAGASMFNHSVLNCNRSMLNIYAHRWLMSFAHFITSLKFFYELTNRSVPKTLTIIF